MKKSLLALAVLASAASAAQAASSVTLYGRVDAGYEKYKGASLVQSDSAESRLGVKGVEDLGNGLQGTFQLETSFGADVGSAGSARESTVGLKGNFGHVRFGKSKSALERTLGDNFQVGNRVADVNVYASAPRHNNAMFYDFAMNGFNFGFDVTTKGGALGNTSEGTKNQKIGYGAFLGYNIAGFNIGLAHQSDRSATIKNETGVGLSYTFKPVTVGLTYAQAKGTSTTTNNKINNMSAYVTADITNSDNVYVKYHRNENKSSFTNGSNKNTLDIIALGYGHSLSKRTSVYADVASFKTKTKSVSNNVVTSSSSSDRSTAYSVGVRHNF